MPAIVEGQRLRSRERPLLHRSEHVAARVEGDDAVGAHAGDEQPVVPVARDPGRRAEIAAGEPLHVPARPVVLEDVGRGRARDEDRAARDDDAVWRDESAAVADDAADRTVRRERDDPVVAGAAHVEHAAAPRQPRRGVEHVTAEAVEAFPGLAIEDENLVDPGARHEDPAIVADRDPAWGLDVRMR